MSKSVDVVSALREDILNDVFPAGSRLVELSLSERYEAPRAAVRSAIMQLTSEGLVEREENRGATVRRVTVAEAIEITEARGALEGFIAKRAAVHATDEERERLTEIGEEMRVAIASGDLFGYGRLNSTLHMSLFDAGHHRIARMLVHNLQNRAVHQQFRLFMVPGRAQESLAEHLAIIEAVVSGDSDAAAEATIKHLNSIATVLAKWFDLGQRP
jgi:DNA-binding GntR family transcriptional regulator